MNDFKGVLTGLFMISHRNLLLRLSMGRLGYLYIKYTTITETVLIVPIV